MNAPSHPLPTPFISVIIPALDEAMAIRATIESVHCAFISHEIIVVDGDSTDDTRNIAERAGARVIKTDRRQRAAQMNLGALSARGEVFLFLYANTHLAPGSLLAIRDALREPRVVGGGFFRRYDSPSRVLAVTCRLAALRNRFFGWHFGDQAIFARCHIFQRCGPFSEVDQFEDLDLSRRIGHCGRIVTLKPAVISAACRFIKLGPAFRTLLDFLLACRYLVRGLTPVVIPAAPSVQT